MGLWARAKSLKRNLRHGPHVDRELDEELRTYIDILTDEKVAAGMPREQARREAMMQLGGMSQVQQAVRESRTGMGIDTFMQDLKFALRTLARDRAFTVLAIVILALGIGANVAVFSVVNRIVLRPLPFADANRLVWMIGGQKLDAKLREAAGLGAVTYQVDVFEEFQRHNRSFQTVTSFNPFYGNSEYTLTGVGQPQGIAAVMVAGNFFQTLGVEPALGRTFVAAELHKGGSPAMLLSDGLWRSHFHADPKIVGQSVELNQRPYTVVGVLPASFDFGAVFAPGMKFDVFVPAVMDELRNWGNTLSMVGRLKPGTSVDQAQSEANTLFVQLQKEHRDWQMDYTPRMVGLKQYVSGGLRRSAMVLWLAVGLVLLIVCVNLSSLLVARATARTKEFAMRITLGAGRTRLLRQLLTESFVVAVTGAALGLALAFALTTYLAQQESVAVPLLNGVRVDGAAVGWTLLLTMVTTFVFGLTPALKLLKTNLLDELKDSGHGMSSGGRAERLRSVMVVAEVALTSVLLVGAGLLLRSFLNTLNENIGFEPSRATVMKIDYGQGQKGDSRGTALQEILRRVDAIPGVETAGVADMLPLGRNRSWQFRTKETPVSAGIIDVAIARVITPGYLSAMGMHLRAGRDLNWLDTSKREAVVIVNQAAARHFWPGQNPIGKLSVVDGDRDARVIGVLSDVRENSLESEAGPEIYVPVMQFDPEGGELVVRSKLPAESLSSSVLAALREMNPGQPANELRPLGSIVDHAVSPRRFFLVLVMSFAALGLVLASLGIYGVIAYSVAQRTQEIGIRMALGASAIRVQWSTMAKTLRLAAAGVAIGTGASLVLARGIAALLYGTATTDPATYAGTVALLTCVAVLAGYLPARRASRINPSIALRR